ncbi:hypothetical protein HMPREF9447_04592 [Bacteroides oleiciplenus YIT 12058]|uniref:Fimbrillin family protein n=2 Tax=Bacteroides oleiciplenus TaxID=626931 RepID=K9DXA5_9BACE|nr:hypothetical protein HMPREF9447_04592 [Bacteroides oleiciplenus YIT 12058]
MKIHTCRITNPNTKTSELQIRLNGRLNGDTLTNNLKNVMNNNLKIWITAALGAGCLCACEGETYDCAGQQPSTVPISIAPALAAQTRGTDITTDNFTTFGVMAYLSQGSDFNTTTSTPNFMYNQKVEKKGSAWEYTPQKYWPGNSGDKLSFFAYAPYNASGIKVPDNNATGYPRFTYTVSTKEADQTDLLAATPLMNRTYASTTGNSVTFNLKHALTKVIFNVQSEINIIVSALSVSAWTTSELTFTDSGFSWENYTGTQEFTASLTENSSGIRVTANAATPLELAAFFLLPDKTGATFSLTYQQDDENPVVMTGNAFPDTPTWEQSQRLTYLLKIKKDGVTVSSSGIGEWESDGEAVDVTGTTPP